MARIRHLRVRIKELASEAKHIRHEEAQCSGMERWHLQHHRKTTVRPAARQYQLAYACLREVSYDIVEPKVRPDRRDVALRVIEDAARIAARFGGDSASIAAWSAAAVIYVKSQEGVRRAA